MRAQSVCGSAWVMMDAVNVRNLIVCIWSQREQGVAGSPRPLPRPSPRVVNKFPPDSVPQKLRTECIMMSNGSPWVPLGPHPRLISTSC